MKPQANKNPLLKTYYWKTTETSAGPALSYWCPYCLSYQFTISPSSGSIGLELKCVSCRNLMEFGRSIYAPQKSQEGQAQKKPHKA
jgi:hypothetical protein